MTRPLVHTYPRGDEADFLYFRDAIVRTGFPSVTLGSPQEIYRSLPQSWNAQWGMDTGLWHAPLYLHLLGFFCRQLHDSAAPKEFGQLCFLLTVGLGVLWLRRLGKIQECRLLGGLFVLLACITPYFVRGSVLIDIDSTLLPLAAVGLLHVVAFGGSLPALSRILLFSLYAAVCFWMKETTLVLFAGVMALHLIRREWQPILEWTVALLVAAGVFSVTWMAYTHAGHLPWNYPYLFLHSNTKLHEIPTLYYRLSAVRWYAAWITFPLSGLFLLALMETHPLDTSKPDAYLQALAPSIALVGCALYSVLVPTVDKYLIPFIPLLLITVCQSLAPRLQRLPLRAESLWKIGLLILVGALLTISLAPDIVSAPPVQARLTSHTFRGSLSDPRFLRYVWAVGIAGSMALLGGILFRRETFGSGCRMGLLMGVLVAGPIQLLHLLPLPYRLLNPAADPGYEETIRFLHDHLNAAGSLATSEKDIAYNIDQPIASWVVDRRINFPLPQESAAQVQVLQTFFNQTCPTFVAVGQDDAEASAAARQSVRLSSVFSQGEYTVYHCAATR